MDKFFGTDLPNTIPKNLLGWILSFGDKKFSSQKISFVAVIVALGDRQVKHVSESDAMCSS